MANKELHIEPLTRIEGHMGAHAVADMENKNYSDAHVYATMFRGLEDILIGREPADAIWLGQRSCGVCPTPHATASVLAVDMAYGAPPPPLGIGLRNLALMAEEIYDGALGCGILEGPDYSESVCAKSNPEILAKAKTTPAPNAAAHGYATIGDIMTALNPVTGSLWLKCLEAGKNGIDMATTLCAKHPHQNNFIPGGIALTVSIPDIESVYVNLAKGIAFTKELVPAFDDLIDFLGANGLAGVGNFPFNLISYGIYDDPTAYNAKYADMSKWGEKRWMVPGVVIDGKLVTNDLVEINVGVQETVTHSYYKDTVQADFTKDPLGNLLTKDHPWNESTKPVAGPEKDWDGKYTWAKTPRWFDWKKRVDGKTHVMQANPLSRMWVQAVSKKAPESTGTSVKFTLPAGNVAGFRVPGEVTMEWKLPAKNNSIERVRARAYWHAYSAFLAYRMVGKALELLKKGETKVWNEYKRPRTGIGVGMVEGMRGAVAHWVVMREGKIYRYQIITPTAWNVSPRDAEGRPGAYEAAIIGSDITEPIDGDLDGVDVVRTIRSFDPCLGCTVQVFNPDNRLITECDLDHLHADEMLHQWEHSKEIEHSHDGHTHIH
ncbi:MAG: nickel-dependent hydrogenase large subunit [Dehalococcoidia bacterium]|nr:nickel-dependent hydrogenase large subunit [Dehalococcoidia bacterium]